MRALLRQTAILGASLLILYSTGFLLPDRASVHREIEIARPPAAVFALINDLKAFDQWWLFASLPPSDRPDKAGPLISGPLSGVGQKQAWLAHVGSDGKAVIIGGIEIIESKADCCVVIAVDLPGWLAGRFRFDLRGSDLTQVEWATDVALDTSFKRWTGYLLADKAMGALEEISLVRLKELAETGTIRRPDPVTPAKTVSPPTAS